MRRADSRYCTGAAPTYSKRDTVDHNCRLPSNDGALDYVHCVVEQRQKRLRWSRLGSTHNAEKRKEGSPGVGTARQAQVRRQAVILWLREHAHGEGSEAGVEGRVHEARPTGQQQQHARAFRGVPQQSEDAAGYGSI